MKRVISVFFAIFIIASSFALNPLVAYSESPIINMNELPLDWQGEYDGHSYGVTPLRRNLNLYINYFSEGGGISGVAIISPSDKGREGYGVNGSYHFKGVIDIFTGEITLQGTSWIEKPIGLHTGNFLFAKFNGNIDVHSKTIVGKTIDGIWEMTGINYDEYTSSNNFKLGFHTNSFEHNNDEGNPLAGFEGLKKHYLDEEYFEALVGSGYRNIDNFNKLNVKYELNKDWNGSCYGIANTMGLLYYNMVDESYLSSNPTDWYYNLPRPIDDIKFLNMVEYYQLSQNLFDVQLPSYNISWCYKDVYGLRTDGIISDSLSVFLRNLVNSVCNDGVKVFSYRNSSQGSGHAVLAVNCLYNKTDRQYKVIMYDMNTVNMYQPIGKYKYMIISNDFSKFSYKEADGTVIIDDTNYKWMNLRDVKFRPFTTYTEYDESDKNFLENLIEDRPMFLSFDSSDNFKISSQNGSYIKCSDGNITNTIPIKNITTVEYGNGSQMTLEIESQSKFVLDELSDEVDLGITSLSSFMSLKGQNITGATFDIDSNSLIVNGDDYNFEAYIGTNYLVDQDEEGLVAVSANAKSDVLISANGEFVNVKSDKDMTDVKCTSLISVDIFTKEYKIPISELEFSCAYRCEDRLFGDIDYDEKITSADALLVLRASVGLENFDKTEKKLADVNIDNSVDSYDALNILRKSVGFDDSNYAGKPLGEADNEPKE